VHNVSLAKEEFQSKHHRYLKIPNDVVDGKLFSALFSMMFIQFSRLNDCRMFGTMVRVVVHRSRRMGLI